MISPSGLAKNIYSDPARFAEMERYYRAVHAALSTTHTAGEQDALAVWEALAMMLAQLTAGLNERAAEGVMAYHHQRARELRPMFAAAGKAARVTIVEDLQ